MKGLLSIVDTSAWNLVTRAFILVSFSSTLLQYCNQLVGTFGSSAELLDLLASTGDRGLARFMNNFVLLGKSQIDVFEQYNGMAWDSSDGYSKQASKHERVLSFRVLR